MRCQANVPRSAKADPRDTACCSANLPDGIRIPASVALPFCVFEKVLGEPVNRNISERYVELSGRVAGGQDYSGELLNELKNVIMEMKTTNELVSSLRAVMKREGLPWPEDWEAGWTGIRRVWASKWNDRAYLSRRAFGISDNDLFMAVLIQEAVEAEYSFVIHTVNPLTRNPGEIYAEAVCGLAAQPFGD